MYKMIQNLSRKQKRKCYKQPKRQEIMKPLLIMLLTIFTITTLVFSQKRQIDSIKILIKNDREDTIQIAHLNYLASLYSKQKKYNNAEKHLLNSLSIAEKIGSLNAIKSVHFDLSELYKASNKPANELEHYKKYISIRDSISNEVKKTTALSESGTNKETETGNSQAIIIGAIASSALFLILTIVLLSRLLKAKKESREVTVLRTTSEDLIKKKLALEGFLSQQKSQLEKYSPIINVDEEISKKKNELTNILSEYENNLTKHEGLQKEVNLLEESLENIDYGFYKPHYTFKTSSEFKVELEKITDEQKEMIKTDKAALCNTDWTVGESKAEGKRMIKQMSKLMLRAFNGEADSAIAKVSWSNVVTMEARINKAHQTIDKFGDTMKIEISGRYKDLKLKELYLNFELEEKQYKEKEEQRRIKEQMREEEKAGREMERAMKEAQEEERRYEKALAKAKQDVDSAQGKELEELNEKIQLLEGKLQTAHEVKDRAVSRAQLTKSGYVYVISNIGSFGEHIYKIGMTRRLDPHDRVYELGDASVPFDFDVHGMIYSDNAPELESILHRKFEIKRVNRVNYRTEFFKVTIEEIESIVKELDLKVELTRLAIAKEYRETLSLIEAYNATKS